MNPNLMRAIDFRVGIPLTVLLTAAYRVQRLLGLAASPVGVPRNTLFIQLAEMGTMVVTYPSLRKARELFPDATLHFLHAELSVGRPPTRRLPPVQPRGRSGPPV